ncbi:MFS transporter [Anaeromyxobacter oryzae]|uniref:MFS transporter n=1 Tax=Anaeromyxobacter oryzae TaxID=2918170 RepID=A0ABN6MJN8_9BACT|nr:MFS transporter [Anaeromyxobacter oryzae]BDG01239.1 MFS transporter [Anaeromyxobacter oryzae]
MPSSPLRAIPHDPDRTLRRLLWLLAATAGLTVANLYYSQPLLPMIAAELHVSARAAGLVSTATQTGYAVGMLLLVPLGDGHERRRLIVVMTAAVAVALLAVAAAQGLAALAAASFVLGATTIVPQLVVPFAVAAAPEGARGRSVGLVMSGLLVGILLSRTVSGVVGGRVGWRATYVGAAVLMVVVAAVLRATLPRQAPSTPGASWARLLASLPRLVRDEPLLRRHALLGAMAFAAFSVFWTTLAFHLAAPPLGYGSGVAGLFGVVGVAGAVAAPIAGRLADRHGAPIVNLGAMTAVLASFGLLAVTGHSLAGLAAGVVVLDFGVQANHISNQTTVLGLSGEQRNRLNTVYMVTYFAGGALGSTAGAWAWNAAGWPGVCAAGAAFSALSLVVWAAVGRRHALGAARRRAVPRTAA